MDCHNRAGHPFRDPESVIDAAFASGELNSDLPYIKKTILGMFEGTVESKDESLVAAAMRDLLARFSEGDVVEVR